MSAISRALVATRYHQRRVVLVRDQRKVERTDDITAEWAAGLHSRSVRAKGPHVVVALLSWVMRGLAWADEPIPPAPGDGSGGSGSSQGTAAVASDVLRTQPQVPTVRGGTLGIPS